MITKSVSYRSKVDRTSLPGSLDDWVKFGRRQKAIVQPSTDHLPVTMKRLTLDIPEDLHKAIKVRSAEEGVAMVDMLRDLLEQHYGQQ